jgi:hypothetical protein
MSKPARAGFTLADIRAIRYLVLTAGAIGIGMMLITDRESPLLVVGFIAVITVVPVVAIYALRRFAKRTERRDSPEPPAEVGR